MTSIGVCSNAIAFVRERSNLFVVIILFCLWFLLFISSGTLFSGFHFMDDHDFVAIHHHLTTKSMSFLEVIVQWLQTDHETGRFRPFYFINRIFQTQFLGINVPLWAAYTALQAVLTTFFFFIFARLLKFSKLQAFLFALLTTVGSQSAVWWMLGPAETIGTFLLSICLIFVALSATSSRWQYGYQILVVIYALLMSLCKESFILMLPAIALLVVWLHQKELSSWKQAIQKSFLVWTALLLICLGELLFVKYFLGTTPDIGYAGVSGFNLTAIWDAIQSLNSNGSGWIILAGLGILIFQAYEGKFFTPGHSISWKVVKKLFFPLVIPFILLGLIAIPQSILYAKSGIDQRYLFPGVVAYSFLIIHIHSRINYHSKQLSQLLVFLIAISLSLKLHPVWSAARIFALEGFSTNRLLSTVIENTTPADSILIVTNPVAYYEWNYSIKKYLNYVGDRENLYVLTFEQQDVNNFGKNLREFYSDRTFAKISNKQSIQCIVVFPSLNNAFLRNTSIWFDPQQYQEFVFGNFNRNLNPNSKMNVYCKK